MALKLSISFLISLSLSLTCLDPAMSQIDWAPDLPSLGGREGENEGLMKNM